MVGPRHLQRDGEVVPQAGGRALAVKAVNHQLWLDNLHRHRRWCSRSFRRGFDLRGSHVHTRHIDVDSALTRRDRYRRRRFAHILGHTAQVHSHRIGSVADHTVDQPLHIEFVVVVVQALAHY